MTEAINPSEDRDELIVAVHALIVEVQGLSTKMAIYAPRAEVTTESRRRAWRFFVLALVVILVCQVMTMTTISYCFLNANNKARSACTLMPGYGQAVQQNEVRLDRFTTLLDATEQINQTSQANDARIEDIEKRLTQLEKEDK